MSIPFTTQTLQEALTAKLMLNFMGYVLKEKGL